MRQIQHGDVLIIEVDKLPAGCHDIERQDGRIIVMAGEATGHHHTITSTGCRLMQLNGQLYLEITADQVTITHEEHKPLTIPTGIYLIGQVREHDYFAEMARSVVD